MLRLLVLVMFYLLFEVSISNNIKTFKIEFCNRIYKTARYIFFYLK